MQTTLHIDGANCSICFAEALDGLGRIEGVTAVDGSIAGSCIEVEHDDVARQGPGTAGTRTQERTRT